MLHFQGSVYCGKSYTFLKTNGLAVSTPKVTQLSSVGGSTSVVTSLTLTLVVFRCKVTYSLQSSLVKRDVPKLQFNLGDVCCNHTAIIGLTIKSMSLVTQFLLP